MFDEFYHRSIWSIILLAVTRLWSIPSCWKRWPWSHSAFQRWSNKVIDSTAFGKFNTTKIPNNKELVVPIFHRSQTLYIYSECKHCPLMRVPFILQGSCRSVMAGGDSFPTACEEAAVSDSWAAQWPGGFLPYTGPALVSTADWCPPKLPVIWVRNQLTYPGPMVEVRVWSQQKSSGETNALYPHRMALLRTSANVTKKGDGLTLTHDTFQTCSAAFLNPGFFPSKKQPRQTWSDPPWLWCKLRAAGMTWRVRWQMRYVMMRYTEEHVRMAWW